jgi:hypothetical protein
MQSDFKKKLILIALLAANLGIAVEAPLPTDLNLCLEVWHSADNELAICKKDSEKWKELAGKALTQRDSAFISAEKEADPNFLGVPPLGWGIIGFVAGGAAGYAFFHR